MLSIIRGEAATVTDTAMVMVMVTAMVTMVTVMLRNNYNK
jgi:hypothetical protein